MILKSGISHPKKVFLKSTLTMFGFLTACAPINTPEPPTSVPVTPVFSQTPGFVFPTVPPSETVPPAPTASPTADPFEGLGEVLFEDDFAHNTGWDLMADEIGAASIQRERLVLTLRQLQGFRFLLIPLQPPRSFFLEFDVVQEICQESDAFGVMLRLNPSFEHYRLNIDCQGMIRISRVLQGESRTLIPDTDTHAILPGPLVSNHLSLWVDDKTLRLWINDIEVFNITENMLKNGNIALFVRSGTGNLVTASFDNLQIRALRTQQ